MSILFHQEPIWSLSFSFCRPSDSIAEYRVAVDSIGAVAGIAGVVDIAVVVAAVGIVEVVVAVDAVAVAVEAPAVGIAGEPQNHSFC